MESSCLLLTLPRPFSAFILRNPRLPALHRQNPLLVSQFRILYVPSYSRWDSNAENLQPEGFRFDEEDAGAFGRKKRRKKKKKRQWWFDDEEEGEVEEEAAGILQEFIDSIWIFKVFRSFGWILPPIILSLLLATGAKAFLMALALAVGQSALSFAFVKLLGKQKHKKRHKVKTSKNPSANYTSNVDREEEEEGESRGARKKKMGYRPWVASNGSPIEQDHMKTPSFGGWDELENSRITQRRRQTTGGSERRTPMSRLSRKEKSQTPLLLRLLIAAFPILGAWTKLFW